MPLVQRTTNRGVLFVNDDEPSDWLNGDLWTETDVSPRKVFVNNAGTAESIGILVEGASAEADNLYDSGNNTTRAGGTNDPTVTPTPNNATNTVIIFANGHGGQSVATLTLIIKDGLDATVATNTKAGATAAICVDCTTFFVKNNVSTSGETFTATSSGPAEVGASIGFVILE